MNTNSTTELLPQSLTRVPAPPYVRAWATALPHIVRDTLGFLKSTRARVGDLYTLDLGLVKAVVLNHPHHAQRVLIDRAVNYTKGGPLWASIRTLLGNGLPVSEGDFWKQQRRMMQPHFHRTRLAALTELMVEAIQEGLTPWHALATSGEAFNVETMTSPITMKVIVKTMFGTGLSSDETAHVNRLFPFIVDYLFQGILTQSFPAWMPVPGRRAYQRALKEMDEIVLGLVERRRQASDESPDLLTTLIQMIDPEGGQQMSNQQLRDEAVSLFLAGYETTSTALSWGLYELTRHPDVVARLQAEVDAQLGGRVPTFADLRNLTYTRQVLQEILRLYPPAWWNSRTAVEADEIDGFRIPAGAQVVPMTYMIHRHPDFWPEPDTFDPERFTPEASARRHHCAWIPFGVGQRQCIGKEFAMMEGQLILAQVMQRYDIRAMSSRPAIPKATTVLKSRDGIWLRLSHRSKVA